MGRFDNSYSSTNSHYTMADAAAPAKTVKAKKPKAPAAHPTYAVMVAAAIMKYICANYKVDAAKAGVPLKLALKKGVAAGTLKMGGAAGKKGAGSFKLGEKAKAEKKPKKKVVKKKPAKKAKKPAAKKAKKPAAKKAAKKPAAKKPAVKKPAAKKPAAKKP